MLGYNFEFHVFKGHQASKSFVIGHFTTNWLSIIFINCPCLVLLRAFQLSARVALSILVTVSFKSKIFHLPHVLAFAMTHILLTVAYEQTALISAMPVWALLIICIYVDVNVNSSAK